jgi:predicted NodU family carbamoyl transferase
MIAVSGIGRTPPTRTGTGLAHLGIDRSRIVPVDHHLSHACTAYCLSPYDTATVLVVDGGGNNIDTETYYRPTPRRDRTPGRQPAQPATRGRDRATYEAFTNWLGRHEQEAGKTMALASYGDPGFYLAPLFDVVDTHVHGRLTRTHAPASPISPTGPDRTGFDFAPPVRPDHADKIAGVVHVDGTARVQTADLATAPAYGAGAPIEHFHQLTGVPVVLNTSFNDREPIVETPAHALATLQACDLDAA